MICKNQIKIKKKRSFFLFLNFNQFKNILELSEPIAAASIAQVHIAKIKNENQEKQVAVKILRPDIEKLFNEELVKEWGIEKYRPYMHVCFYIYNKNCGWWFEEIINHYTKVIVEKPEDYKRLYLWNDEGIDNAMRWKYGCDKFLPLSNFDTSGYDGDLGNTNEMLHHFYKFWNEEGPQNFNRIFGYQFIPKDKSKIIYFHGNKHAEISDKMIDFIKMMKNNSFYKSELPELWLKNPEESSEIQNEFKDNAVCNNATVYKEFSL